MSTLKNDLIVSPQDLYITTDTAQADLGAKAVTADGREFRYAKAGGTALIAGTLLQAPAIVANHQNIAVAAAASAGSTTVTVTLGATEATANQYAGGLMIVNDADGQGFSYQISSNVAAALSTAMTITLSDKLMENLTTSSEVCLIPALYNGVVINPTTPTNVPVGVAVLDIPAGDFGWIQTKGAVSCLADGALTVGAAVSPSNGTAGAVEDGVIAQGFVGSALQAGVSTEYRTISINL